MHAPSAGTEQQAFLQAASSAQILVGVDLDPTGSSSNSAAAPPAGTAAAVGGALESFLQRAAQEGQLPATRLVVGSAPALQALTLLGGLALGDPRATWLQSFRLDVAK